MIPLKDFNPTRRIAVLTIGLIILNVLAFVYQQTKPDDGSLQSQQAFVCEYSLIPDHVLHGPDPQADARAGVDPQAACQSLNQEQNRYLGLVTSLFLHGSWLHLLGNMLFLWVFGNNVEDALGRARFIPFYLLCGVLAALAQAISDPDSAIPLIGASGAISGVLGAYLVLHPRSLVLTLILPFFLVPIPAWLTLGLYFVLQFVYLAGESTVGAGTAYWAHIGGFVAGLVLIKAFMVGRPPPLEGRPRPAAAGRWG
ncbi:MAG: rhomboid family intramembrane serine protease [Actinomycetota bacterium]